MRLLSGVGECVVREYINGNFVDCYESYGRVRVGGFVGFGVVIVVVL